MKKQPLFVSTLSLIISLRIVLNQPTPFNNIDFFAKGYDIYKGFPLSSGIDPGFKSTKIFSLGSSTGHPSDDNRFLIPNGVLFQKLESCQISFDSKVIKSEREFQQRLSVQASVEGSGTLDIFTGSFRLSVDYETYSRDFESHQTDYIISNSTCQVYQVTLDTRRPPALTTGFIDDAKEFLKSPANSDNYQNFIDTYGTHFINLLNMGAQFSVVWSFSKTDLKTLQQEKVTVDRQASMAAAGIVSAGSSTTVGHETETGTTFSDTVTRKFISTIGSKPPVGNLTNATEQWAQQSFDNPMPVSYSLTEIGQLFSPQYWENVPLDGLNLTEISANMIEEIPRYCLQQATDSSVCTSEASETLIPREKFTWQDLGYASVANDSADSAFGFHYSDWMEPNCLLESFIFQDNLWLYTKLKQNSCFYTYQFSINSWQLSFCVQVPGWDDIENPEDFFKFGDVTYFMRITVTNDLIYMIVSQPGLEDSTMIRVHVIDKAGTITDSFDVGEFQTNSNEYNRWMQYYSIEAIWLDGVLYIFTVDGSSDNLVIWAISPGSHDIPKSELGSFETLMKDFPMVAYDHKLFFAVLSGQENKVQMYAFDPSTGLIDLYKEWVSENTGNVELLGIRMINTDNKFIVEVPSMNPETNQFELAFLSFDPDQREFAQLNDLYVMYWIDMAKSCTDEETCYPSLQWCKNSHRKNFEATSDSEFYHILYSYSGIVGQVFQDNSWKLIPYVSVSLPDGNLAGTWFQTIFLEKSIYLMVKLPDGMQIYSLQLYDVS